MLSRFRLIPEHYGWTDRQTDRFAISILRVSVLTRDKNEVQYTTIQNRLGLLSEIERWLNVGKLGIRA